MNNANSERSALTPPPPPRMREMLTRRQRVGMTATVGGLLAAWAARAVPLRRPMRPDEGMNVRLDFSSIYPLFFDMSLAR